MATDVINKLFTIVCISCVPVAALIILFNFVVLAAARQRSLDLATVTLLLGRIGHSCVVVLMLGIYTLEGSPWTPGMCRTLVWLWITFWTVDLFTSLIFLLYTSIKLGHKKHHVRCHMVFLLLLSWGVAVLLGATTYLTDWLYHNYTDLNQTCSLGLSIGDQPIRIGALFIIIMGGLLIIVLMITISAESRAQALKYKIQHPEVIQATNSTKRKQPNGNAHKSESYEIIDITNQSEYPTLTSSNGSVPNGQVGSNHSNNNNNVWSRGEDHVRTWRYIDSQMRDTRHVYGSAVTCTVLLNLLPQLVLYSMNSVTGTQYLYTHHILMAAGLLHSVVLPVAFCTTGLRYKMTATRLVKNTFGGSDGTRQDSHNEIAEDADHDIVFHIRDVTLSETSDAPGVPSATPSAIGDDVKTGVTVPNQAENYKREQLQVLSMSGSPSIAPSQANRHGDAVQMTTVALVSSRQDSIKGTDNPAYVHDEHPQYLRSQSDGVVDYYDSESEWGSWDSDSETWSNLYDESDIEDVLDNRSRRSNSLSPHVNHKRRRSSHYTLIEIHHKRNLSAQLNGPPDGSSPRRERRKSVEDLNRKRKRRSRRHRRRASRDLAGEIEKTAHIGVASTMVSQHRSLDGETGESVGHDNRQYPDNQPYQASVPYYGHGDTQYHDTNLQYNEHATAEDNDQGKTRRNLSFGSELAASANRFRRSYDEQDESQRHTKEEEDVRYQEMLREKKRTKAARRESSRRIVTIQEERNRSMPPQKPDRRPSRNSSSSSQTDGRVARGKVSILRKKSSSKQQAPQVPSTGMRNSAPASVQYIDPMLADMTLTTIMSNPKLTEQLRRSLESLNSVDEPTKEQASEPPAPVASPVAAPQPVAAKAKPQTLYEIPSIDSDHRYRPRKPVRRGIQGFRAAAKAVAIAEFLKKSNAKMDSSINRTSSTAGSSFGPDSDLSYL